MPPTGGGLGGARPWGRSELIVVWGGNPVHTQVNFMHWVQQARRGRDVPLVVIDPYRTATAAKADLHLALRPGTDGALACAVMHVLLAEGLADRAYLARLTDFSPAVEAHLASHMDRLPAGDTASRAIVVQMKADEARHAEDALHAGGAPLPAPVRGLMRLAAKAMTTTAHRL